MQSRPKFNEQQRKKLEHSLTDLRRFFIDQKFDTRHTLAGSVYQSGLFAFLLDFVIKTQSDCFECPANIYSK